jgi:hypothetical protein
VSAPASGHTIRVMRSAFVAVLCALALGLAGCGSEDVTGGGESGAELLRAGALVYWESTTDPDSEQWNQTEELLRRFPDGDTWIRELRRSFESDTDVRWDEVKAALGDELIVAVYARSLAAGPNVVGLLDPEDPDETVALVKKLNESDDEGDDVVTRVVDGWVVLSDREASIDAALKGEGPALSGDDGFQAAMDELPGDALSRVYFDAAAALDVFGEADAETGRQLRMLGLDDLDFGGAWAKAKDDGAELAFTLRGDGANRLLGTGDPYSSELIDRVPADAFAFYSFRGDAAREQVEQFKSNPLYSMGLRDLERQLGVDVEQLAGLFEGEVVFYARRGTPIPELTLVLDGDDPTQANRLLRSLAEKTGGEVTEDGGVTTATFEEFSVNVGAVEGAVVISSSKDPFSGGAAEDTLADNERYTDALEAAGAPDEYTGLAWVDLQEAVRFFIGLAGTSGEQIPPEVERNLKPLRSLVAYGEQDGNIASSLVFVGIE